MSTPTIDLESVLRASHHGRIWLKNKSETQLWLGKAHYGELSGFFKSERRVGPATGFSARDIISLPFSALKSIALSSQYSKGLKRILLESGYVYYHVVQLLFEKKDQAGLAKLLQVRFGRHLESGPDGFSFAVDLLVDPEDPSRVRELTMLVDSGLLSFFEGKKMRKSLAGGGGSGAAGAAVALVGVKSPYLVSLVPEASHFLKDEFAWLMVEPYARDTLAGLLGELRLEPSLLAAPQDVISFDHLWNLVRALVGAVASMHNEGAVHKAICAETVVIDGDHDFKIAPVSVRGHGSSRDRACWAPELCDHNAISGVALPFSMDSDLWALGALLLRLFVHRDFPSFDSVASWARYDELLQRELGALRDSLLLGAGQGQGQEAGQRADDGAVDDSTAGFTGGATIMFKTISYQKQQASFNI